MNLLVERLIGNWKPAFLVANFSSSNPFDETRYTNTSQWAEIAGIDNPRSSPRHSPKAPVLSQKPGHSPQTSTGRTAPTVRSGQYLIS